MLFRSLTTVSELIPKCHTPMPCRTLTARPALSIGWPVLGVTPAVVGRRSDLLSRQTVAQETNENHCDSFCDRRKANGGDWVLIGIPARTDLLTFWNHLSILDWLVVPVAEGSNPSTHPTIIFDTNPPGRRRVGDKR